MFVSGWHLDISNKIDRTDPLEMYIYVILMVESTCTKLVIEIQSEEKSIHFSMLYVETSLVFGMKKNEISLVVLRH